MKFHFTTASRIAEASMGFTWKENLLLLCNVLISAVLFFIGIAMYLVLAVIIFAIVMAILSGTIFVGRELVETISYPGVAGVCLFGAYLIDKLCKKDKMKPVFYKLARGVFWYFILISFFLAAAGILYAVSLYGEFKTFGTVGALFLLLGAWRWWRES